jgi:hypothetical protein
LVPVVWALHDELEGLNGPSLTKTMNTVNRLSDGSWVVLGLHGLDGTMTLAARTRALEEFAKNDNIKVLLATIGAGASMLPFMMNWKV